MTRHNVWRNDGTQTSSADGHSLKEHHMPHSPSVSRSAAEAVLQDDGGARAATLRAIALLIALTACLITLGHASMARAEGCANAELRAVNNSEGLPDCRAYEMVSPPYKEGFTIDQRRFSDDGAAVSFVSTGSFAEGGVGFISNLYVATRSSTGWTTVAPNPPTGIYDTAGADGADALSADLRWVLWRSQRRVAPVDDTEYYYLTGLDGSITRVGPSGNFPLLQATSADLSHVVWNYSSAGGPLYEFVGTGHTAPGRPVSVDNDGEQLPGLACGKGMSVDGRVIFLESGCSSQLWARVDASATIAVSRSQCTRPADDPAGPCSGVNDAVYQGSAVDGSRVFFTTTQQLVNGDTDTTSDLYACDIPDGAPAPVGDANSCTTLRQISGGVSSARVQSVTAVSDDGSRVYFTAQGVLADNLGTNNAVAVDGRANLYLWSSDAAHPAGQITFVTDLAGGGMANPRVTPDGRYLVFGTSAALVKDGPGADTDSNAVDLYRYDAETRSLVRVSTGRRAAAATRRAWMSRAATIGVMRRRGR